MIQTIRLANLNEADDFKGITKQLGKALQPNNPSSLDYGRVAGLDIKAPETEPARPAPKRTPGDELNFWRSYFRKELDSQIFSNKKNTGSGFQSIIENTQTIINKYLKILGISEDYLSLINERTRLVNLKKQFVERKKNIVTKLKSVLSPLVQDKEGSLQNKEEYFNFNPIELFNLSDAQFWIVLLKNDDLIKKFSNVVSDKNEYGKLVQEIGNLKKEEGNSKVNEKINEIELKLSNIKPKIDTKIENFIFSITGKEGEQLSNKANKFDKKQRIELFYDLLEKIEPFWLDYFTILDAPQDKLFGVSAMHTLALHVSKTLDGYNKELNINIQDKDRDEIISTFSQEEIEKAEQTANVKIKEMSMDDVSSFMRLFKQQNYTQLTNMLNDNARAVYLQAMRSVDKFQQFVNTNKQKIIELLSSFNKKQQQYSNVQQELPFEKFGLNSLSDEDKDLFRKIPLAAGPFTELIEFLKLSNLSKKPITGNIDIKGIAPAYFEPGLAFIVLYHMLLNDNKEQFDSILANPEFAKSEWGQSLMKEIKENTPLTFSGDIRQILELRRFMLDDTEVDSDTEIDQNAGIHFRGNNNIGTGNAELMWNTPGKRAYLDRQLKEDDDQFATNQFHKLLKLKQEIKVFKKDGELERVQVVEEEYNEEKDRLIQLFSPVLRDYMAQRYLDTTLIETQNFLYSLISVYSQAIEDYDPAIFGPDVIGYLVDKFDKHKRKVALKYYTGPKRLFAVPETEEGLKGLFDLYASVIGVKKTNRYDLRYNNKQEGTDGDEESDTNQTSLKPMSSDIRTKGFRTGKKTGKFQIGTIKTIRGKKIPGAPKIYKPTKDAIGHTIKIIDELDQKEKKYQITQEDVESGKTFKTPTYKEIPIFGSLKTKRNKRVQYEAYPAESIIKNPREAKKAVRSVTQRMFNSLVEKLNKLTGAGEESDTVEFGKKYTPVEQDIGKTISIISPNSEINSHTVSQEDIESNRKFYIPDLNLLRKNHNFIDKKEFIATDKDIGKQIYVVQKKKASYTTKGTEKNPGKTELKTVFQVVPYSIKEEDIGKKFYVPTYSIGSNYNKSVTPTVDSDLAHTRKIKPKLKNKQNILKELIFLASTILKTLNISEEELIEKMEKNIIFSLRKHKDANDEKYSFNAESLLKSVISNLYRGEYNRIFEDLYGKQSEKSQFKSKDKAISREYADSLIMETIQICLSMIKKGMEELDEKVEQGDLASVGSSFTKIMDSLQERLMAALLHHVAKVNPTRTYLNANGQFVKGDKTMYNLVSPGTTSIKDPSLQALHDPKTGLRRKYAKNAAVDMFEQSQDASSDSKQTAMAVLMNTINRYTHRILNGDAHYSDLHKKLGQELDRDIKRAFMHEKQAMFFGNSSTLWSTLNKIHHRIIIDLGDEIVSNGYYIESPEWFEKNDALREKAREIARTFLKKAFDNNLSKRQALGPRGEKPNSKADARVKDIKSTEKLGGSDAGTSPDFQGYTDTTPKFAPGKSENDYIEKRMTLFDALYEDYLHLKNTEAVELDAPVDSDIDEGTSRIDTISSEVLGYVDDPQIVLETLRVFLETLSSCFSSIQSSPSDKYNFSATDVKHLNGILKQLNVDINDDPLMAREYYHTAMNNLDNKKMQEIVSYKFLEYIYIREVLLTRLFTAMTAIFNNSDASNQEVVNLVNEYFKDMNHKPEILENFNNQDLATVRLSYIIKKYFGNYANILDPETTMGIIAYIGNSSDTSSDDSQQAGEYVAYKKDSETQGAVAGGDLKSSPQEDSKIAKIDKNKFANLGIKNIFSKIANKMKEDKIAANEKYQANRLGTQKNDSGGSYSSFIKAVDVLNEFSKKTIDDMRDLQKDKNDILNTVAELRNSAKTIKSYLALDNRFDHNAPVQIDVGTERVGDQKQGKLIKLLDKIIKNKNIDAFRGDGLNSIIKDSKVIVDILDELEELPKNYKAKRTKAQVGIARSKKQELIDNLKKLLDSEINENTKNTLKTLSKEFDSVIKMSIGLSNPQKSELKRSFNGLSNIKEQSDFKKQLEKVVQQISKLNIKSADKDIGTEKTTMSVPGLKTDFSSSGKKEEDAYVVFEPDNAWNAKNSKKEEEGEKKLKQIKKPVKESLEQNKNEIIWRKLLSIIKSNVLPSSVLKFKTKHLREVNNNETPEQKSQRLRNLAGFIIRLSYLDGQKVDKYTLYDFPDKFKTDYIITEPDSSSENEKDFIAYIIPRRIISI